MTAKLDLSTFDGRLMNGLVFCRKVYDWFEQVQNGPGGVKRLRLRPTKSEKRLVEELIPLARYVQARYVAGRRIKVRWVSGDQSYDAVLLSSGGAVEHGVAPKRQYVEVTVATHHNDYYRRLLLEERGGSFGPEGISRDRKTGKLTSTPTVQTPSKRAQDLADQILTRLKAKSGKTYPPGTVLVIDCVPNGLTVESEWIDAVQRVENERQHLGFSEVFILDSWQPFSATLFGPRQPDRTR